jgi:threonine/homoserine/homoserine lactone efflux protein
MLWYNPKGWAMTVSAAASFVALAEGPIRLGLLLGVTFGLAAVGSLSLWCAAGLLLARVVRTETEWRVLNVALGVLLAASILPIWL